MAPEEEIKRKKEKKYHNKQAEAIQNTEHAAGLPRSCSFVCSFVLFFFLHRLFGKWVSAG